MKSVTIIGASGYVGIAILKEALNRNFQVRAIVRHPEKLAIEDHRLEIIKGDVTQAEEVKKLTQGAGSVISAYNPGWKDPDIYNHILQGYKAIINGVKQAGVKRLLVVGGAGRLFIMPGLRLLDSGEVPQDILPGVKGQAQVYFKLLQQEKQLDWVFFSPAASLEPGKRTGVFKLGKDDLITDANGDSRISIEDYAVAMIDELEEPKHHREAFTIGYE